MIRPLRLLAAGALTAAALGLSACAGTVAMESAPAANDPVCAAVTVMLPDVIAGQDRRWTDAQATGAWGSPASVLMTCGVEPPGPSELECRSIEGVDWLIDASEAPKHYRFTTFGREPAVEVYVDDEVIISADALMALSPILDQKLAETGAVCTPRGSAGSPG